MARIFITGSADGLGQLAARELVNLGHKVVLHARNADRGKYAMQEVPGAADVLIADLSSIDETKVLAGKANDSGRFEVVIHNAGVYRLDRNSIGAEGLPIIFAVNSLAPYMLTCLMQKPERLIYLSSGMHMQGNPNLKNLPIGISERNSHITYSDTKLHNVILSMAVARKWTDVISNAVDPGWVPTKMGGTEAPDNLEKGYQTQVWLAVSNDPEAMKGGQYFHHKRQARFLMAAKDSNVQDKLLEQFEQITGVHFSH